MTDAEIRASKREHERMRERIYAVVGSGTPSRVSTGLPGYAGGWMVWDYANERWTWVAAPKRRRAR